MANIGLMLHIQKSGLAVEGRFRDILAPRLKLWFIFV
jgi:hypothetical protein